MRYAEAKYGEHFIAVGVFEPGDSVTIQVLDLATDAFVPLDLAGCTESAQIPGRFIWSAENVTPPYPTGLHQCLYVMTNAAGQQHDGKLVIGGYPSDSAKRRFQEAVYIDVANGVAGTDFDIGTPENPVSNVADARTIAARENLTTYRVNGAISISTDHLDWTFEGVEPTDDYVTFAATANIEGSQFLNIGIRGDLVGSITVQNCLIGVSGGTVTGLAGTFDTCGFDGTLRIAPASAIFQGLNLASQNANVVDPGTVIDFNDSLCVVRGEFKGIWKVRNIVHPFAIVAMIGAGLDLTLESTVAGGSFTLLGVGELHNQATSVATLNDAMVRGSRLNKVWDGTVGTRLVDQTTDPAQWKLRVRKGDDDSVISHSFDLADGEGDPISDANPLTQFIGERQRGI